MDITVKRRWFWQSAIHKKYMQFRRHSIPNNYMLVSVNLGAWSAVEDLWAVACSRYRIPGTRLLG